MIYLNFKSKFFGKGDVTFLSEKKYTDNDSGNATNITGGNISMLNCLGIGDNCCLWMLIIILILCLCKNGCLNGIIDKICGCGCLLPVLLLLLCCCKGGKGGPDFGFGGGCCK